MNWPPQLPHTASGVAPFVLDPTGRRLQVTTPSAHRVLVIGSGIAGLTAAHELADRGYEVTVYERKALGGKSRTISVPLTGRDGRADLPGEHGYRYVPGFYQHLPDTMARIPAVGVDGSVWDRMVPQSGFLYARAGTRQNLPILFHVDGALTRQLVQQLGTALFQQFRALPPTQVMQFLKRLVVFMTSCTDRRFEQWEHITWWDFVRAESKGHEYQKLLVDAVTEHLVAARGDLASARAIGGLGEAYAYSLLGRATTGENGRVFDAPTSEAWISPWIKYLRERGVKFVVGVAAEQFIVENRRISAAIMSSVSGALRVEADWFVCAIPVERARALLSGDVLRADPTLATLGRLQTEWMNGIQFYLRHRLPIINGPVVYVDSPWGLVSASESQWWRSDFASTYGDGSVRDCLSVNIANFDAPGIVYGKPARECTAQELAHEVLTQMRAALNVGGPALPDDIIASWFVDPALRFTSTGLTNDEPLFVNYAGAWEARPEAITAIPNLFLAGDYVRDNLSAATMEGANQTGRLAANGVLAASYSETEPAKVFCNYDSPAVRAAKDLDAKRFRRGLPHLLDRV